MPKRCSLLPRRRRTAPLRWKPPLPQGYHVPMTKHTAVQARAHIFWDAPGRVPVLLPRAARCR